MMHSVMSVVRLFTQKKLAVARRVIPRSYETTTGPYPVQTFILYLLENMNMIRPAF